MIFDDLRCVVHWCRRGGAASRRLGGAAARRRGAVQHRASAPRRLSASAAWRGGSVPRLRASAPPFRAPPCPSVPLRAPPCLRAYLRLRIPLCLCAPPRHSESLRAPAPPHAHVNALRPRRPPGSARRAGSAAHTKLRLWTFFSTRPSLLAFVVLARGPNLLGARGRQTATRRLASCCF